MRGSPKTLEDALVGLVIDLTRLLTDLRTWVAAALVFLTDRILVMVGHAPSLTSNQGFMFLAQALIVGGFVGGVVAFLYTAAKPSAPSEQPPPVGAPAYPPVAPPVAPTAVVEPAPVAPAPLAPPPAPTGSGTGYDSLTRTPPANGGA